jgi:mRNA-degrading endonuclease RelE of RelBE toxin-antitoxin system
MAWNVYQSTLFEKEIQSFPREFMLWIESIKNQLMENPYVGKPLRAPWLREKKYGKYRLLYLVYDDLHCVYVVRICDKKNQQLVIDTILAYLSLYREEVKKLART